MKIIKKILLSLLIAVTTFVVVPFTVPISEWGYTVEANSQKVYVTPTGKRYHLISTCGGKNSTLSTLSRAKARGLTPCQKCADDYTMISNSTTTSKTTNKTKIKINKTKYIMNKGQIYTLKISGTKKEVKWSTSNKKVATVSSKGKVTAKKIGKATITAKVGGKKYKCKIEVKDPSISKSKVYIRKSETYILKVKDTNQKIKWSTSNKKVATVNSKGKVTAKKNGTATITAKVGKKKLKCKVTVETMSISKTKITLEEGNTYTLQVKDTKQSVKWSSSDKNVATVDSKGKVTAKKAGTVAITAKVGEKKLKCKVTVKEFNYQKNISISYLETETSVIAILTNNNSVAISIEPDMIFYDKDGNIQSRTSEFNYCFEPKSTIALEFKSYNSSTYQDQTYSSYKLVFSEVSKSFYSTYGVKNISVSSNKTDGSVIAQVSNISSNEYDTIQIAIVFYDINNNAIGYDYTYVDCGNSGSTDYVDLYYPYDENYDEIEPASYKIYVNHAYQY